MSRSKHYVDGRRVLASWLRRGVAIGGLGLLLLAAGCPSRQGFRGVPVEKAAEQLAEFNRGAGLMEQYHYAEAAVAFEKVLAVFPDWMAARFNLGLAHLNMAGEMKPGTREEGRKMLESSREAFAAVLAADPQHAPASFALGMYYQHVGEDEKAVACFQAVYQQDPEDPYVVYKYADALQRTNRNDESGSLLEQVAKLDPGFVSAIYRLGLQNQRAGKTDEAQKLFQRFRQLNAAELAGGTFAVQEAYGAAGKYYRVLGADNLPLRKATSKPGRRVLFSPDPTPLEATAVAWDWSGGRLSLPSIAVGDVDGDEDLDLCCAGLGENGATTVWLNDGAGHFTTGPPIGDRAVSLCLGDLDNDGDLDLWVGRAGPAQLFENDGQGHFRLQTKTSLGPPDVITALARLVDLDSDGDLDLLAFRWGKGSVPVTVGVPGERRGVSPPVPVSADVRPAASSLYNNNRDGTMADVTKEWGLELADMPLAAVVYDDFDDDRDLDLMLFPAGARQPIAWVNDRAGAFHLADASATGCDAQQVLSATSGDFNKDGRQDLLVFTAEGARLYANRGRVRFEADGEFTVPHGRLGGSGGQFVDLDNDGDLDIVIADADRRGGTRGPLLLLNDWPNARFVNANEADAGSLLNAIQTEGHATGVAADFTGDGKCDILWAPSGQKPLLLENATPGGHWIALDLRGLEAPDKTTRSSNSAIGARVEVKTGAVLQQFTVGGNAGVGAVTPLRIHAGLGDNAQVDWLRIRWPDAVLQAELELPADQVRSVEEVQRKTSSCPYLFAWDGKHFDFVADFGGVGGLGFWESPGRYVTPDPTEYVPIPNLQPRDGAYVLQCVTPLEEITYLDEVQLVAVDHPEGTEIFPHEMMAVRAAPPPFEVFCVRERIEPIQAVDQRGQDVTESLRRVDRRCAGPARRDRRFLGLAEEHSVELDFGERLQQLPPEARCVLFLNGWVEYPYSSTNYAAHQAGLRAQAPSLHVWRDGGWVELCPEVGYPAGINHWMTIDVTGKLRPDDRRLRISTNMDLSWDCLFLAEHAPDGVRAQRTAAPDHADLHFRGYPREYSPDGRHPNLSDYDNLDRTAPWKRMAGAYTRYGDVAELLHEADDCFVIMGHGEEVTLQFAADTFGPVPAGCRRTFLLKTDSFCKDMDLYTAHPDTVEPLPFHGMSGYPYRSDEQYPDTARTREYRQRYNTRWIGERAGGTH
jgi:tetratricopeptide (TPR) repeat protein